MTFLSIAVSFGCGWLIQQWRKQNAYGFCYSQELKTHLISLHVIINYYEFGLS